MNRTIEEVLRRARQARDQSPLVRAVSAARPDGGRAWALGDRRLRPLGLTDIEILESLGNSCAGLVACPGAGRVQSSPGAFHDFHR